MFKQLISILFFVPFYVFGQNTDSLQTSEANIKIDKKVNALLDNHIKLNKKTGLMGWRLQIFSNTNREEAQKRRKQFLLNFPGIPAYLTHKEPYFKVTVGNFYTKLHAKKTKNEIKKKYHSYIVPSEIIIYD